MNMKSIYLYFTAVLFVLCTGLIITGCKDDKTVAGGAEGLSLKVYSPTKVVEGQVVTITGTGLSEVTSVVFPGDQSVTSINVINDNMISVVTPAGIPAAGGVLTVNTSSSSVTAPIPVTVGVPAFSAMNPSGTVGANDELLITGTDLEFIKQIIFPGENEGEVVVVNAIDFLRVSTGFLRLKVPNGILNGIGQIKMVTAGGKEILLPEVELKSAPSGEWRWTEFTIWEGAVAVDWGKEFLIQTSWFVDQGIARDDTVKFYLKPDGTPMIKFYNDGWKNDLDLYADKNGTMVHLEDAGQTAKSNQFVEDNTKLTIPMTDGNLAWFTPPHTNINATGAGATITKITLTKPVWYEIGAGDNGLPPLKYAIYDSGYQNGFDYGWWLSVKPDPDCTDVVREGSTKSLKVTFGGGWSGAVFPNWGGINTSSYGKFEMSVYGGPGTDGMKIQLGFSDQSTHENQYPKVFTVVEGEWVDFSFPIDDVVTFNNPILFNMQDQGMGGVVYFDRIGFMPY
jgi:hypothetical protein